MEVAVRHPRKRRLDEVQTLEALDAAADGQKGRRMTRNEAHWTVNASAGRASTSGVVTYTSGPVFVAYHIVVPATYTIEQLTQLVFGLGADLSISIDNQAP